MKLKEKISIDFEEFFSTGKFDFLKLGKTKEWIINNFPDPDGYDEHPAVYKSAIWTYGNIELHFDRNKLVLIFSDYIYQLDGGNSLELKKWFIDNTEKLKLSDVISVLHSKHIDYKKSTDKIIENAVKLELESGVDLRFHLNEKIDEDYEVFLERCKNTNQNEYELSSFSLMAK